MPEPPVASSPASSLPEDLQKVYDDISANVESLQSLYQKWLKAKWAPSATSATKNSDTSTSRWYLDMLQREMSGLGFSLDESTGGLSYTSSFQPLELPYEICYVRHGRTQGNTEPRVFQGQVDYPENQLNAIGKEQAEVAAARMEEIVNTWTPDLIVMSPLTRARDTAAPFLKNHKNIPAVVVQDTAEQAFGEWDNVKVKDLDKNTIGHLFYLTQNALVKADTPHNDTIKGWEVPSENFCELLLRMRLALLRVAGMLPAASSEQQRRAKVLFYGHSMAGAAVQILMGRGRGEGEGKVGWDGSYIMPNATPTMLLPAKPYSVKQS